ncbi:unnamed protein product [Adineta ricciae]|nr:unnamed protein product [Adineta ricciae]
MAAAYGIQIFGYSVVTCKLLTYLLFWSRTLPSWFIALASIDRSRSVSLRTWSSLRVAFWANLITTIAVGLAYIYVLFVYTTLPGSAGCSLAQGSARSFNGIWNLIIFSLGPPLIMLYFGSLTIRHLRQSAKQVRLQKNQTNVQSQPQLQRQKKTDRQLIQMMIVQCVYFSVTSSSISINWIYVAARPPLAMDALQVAKDDLFAQITGFTSLTGACTSFYLFTLSSKLFRSELVNLFKRQQRRFGPASDATRHPTQKVQYPTLG